MASAPHNPSELEKLQFDYAWKWFAFHADQRVKMFNFMLLVTGVLATAVATAYDHDHADIAHIISIAGAAFAFVFGVLDFRNRNLVWLGEDILVELEKSMIFGENGTLIDRNNKQTTLGILWRQKRQEKNDDCKFFYNTVRGKHRVWNPAIAILIIAFFVYLAHWISAHP